MPYTVHHKISELIIKHLRGELQGAERTELDTWLASSPENRALYEELTTEETLAKEVKDINGIRARILNSIYKQAPELSPVIPMYRRKVFKWIAAASVILVMGYGLWVMSGKKSTVDSTQTTAATNDVQAPKETRAVITLANEQKVYLDNASNGTIAQENNVSVVKKNNGEIVYNSTVQPLNNSTQYNTLFNPRGSKVISLTLSDGTKVWLNSGSSLRYPASFASSAVNREVEITGEAYFEVAHIASKPFHVKKGETDVTVLGTHFNVNAYDDEDALRVTLLEGSVKVSRLSTHDSRIIKPGQQAVFNTTSHSLLTTSSVDLDEVMAWKNGIFQFGEKVDIGTIMRQISRWYDVDVEYKGEVTQHFGGAISREVSIAQVLKVMEATGGVKFKVDGKKVIVMKP
jgi:transmembrane sensor